MAKLKVKELKDAPAEQKKLGLFLKTTLVGFILAIPATSGALHVNNIHLQKQYQGLGYDEVLLDAAEEVASESGYDRISLEIHPHQYHQFQPLGFVKEGERYNRDGIEYQKIIRRV